jgi:hypothetical protein
MDGAALIMHRDISQSEKRDIHPIDKDLSLGTPDLGHPGSCAWRIRPGSQKED